MNNKRGFTLLEIMVIVAIIGILYVAVTRGFPIITDRLRYAKALREMKILAVAAGVVHATDQAFAPEVGPDTLPPEFTTQVFEWPAAPCPGWTYDYENWEGIPGHDNTIRISLRKADFSNIGQYCVHTDGDCTVPTHFTGPSDPIQDKATQRFTCNE